MGGIVTCLNELPVLVEYAQVNLPDSAAPRALIFTYCPAVPTGVSIFTSSVVTSPSFSPTSGPPDTSVVSIVVGGVIALLFLFVCVCCVLTCCIVRWKRKVLLSCFLWRGSYLIVGILIEHHHENHFAKCICMTILLIELKYFYSTGKR